MKNVFKILGSSLAAIFQGKFFLKIKMDRYFPHIVYVFILFALVIWISLLIENTLGKVEKRKEEIRTLEITALMKRYELEKINDRKTILGLLEKHGSELTEPTKPATVLKND